MGTERPVSELVWFSTVFGIILFAAVGVIAAVLLAGCEPAPWEQRYGYYLAGDSPSYPFTTTQIADGIEIDTGDNEAGEILARRIATQTGSVEACLETSIDRSSFRVKIPNDWTLSCDGSQQVLPFATPDRMCKGAEATPDCPCRYRAILQEPNVVVVTPNLLLFRDALIRLVTGSNNPWDSPTLSVCASPYISTEN